MTQTMVLPVMTQQSEAKGLNFQLFRGPAFILALYFIIYQHNYQQDIFLCQTNLVLINENQPENSNLKPVPYTKSAKARDDRSVHNRIYHLEVHQTI